MCVEIQLFEVGTYFLQKELPLLLEEVPLAKRMCMTEPLHIIAVCHSPNHGSASVVSFSGHQAPQTLLL
jgi:hypothetical protein